MCYVYVLKLENNKWYIGKSIEIAKRLKKHFNGRGSEWTKLNSPIKIDLICWADPIFEYVLTMAYANKYGISNVRGYCYCQRYLTEDQIYYFINQMAK